VTIPTAAEIAIVLRQHGWTVPTGLHVVLCRNKHGAVDAFDDMAVWVRGDAEIVHAARCTTDPGKGPRMDPKNPAGCAVWAESQVPDGLGFGKHHGDYECWVPVKPIPVLRYDSLTDTTGTPSTSMTTQVHRASATHESGVVGAWSEGCAVYANPADFGVALRLAKASGQTRFTVSLVVR
jgi:hypothetical protein